MNPDNLVVSIGFNGYATAYRRCVRSHEQWCRTHGYSYLLVNDAPFRPRAHESAWFKLPLILAGLRTGYDWVAFIDADCEIRQKAPSIQSVHVPGKTLYMATGLSGRLNSGVILVHNHAEVVRLLEAILAAAEMPVPAEDEAPYENGHVIHYAKSSPTLQVLDPRWNNTSDPGLDDFIRHYCGGQGLRRIYRRSWSERTGVVCNRLRRAVFDRLGWTCFHPGPLHQCLQDLTAYCVERHAQLMPMSALSTPDPEPAAPETSGAR